MSTRLGVGRLANTTLLLAAAAMLTGCGGDDTTNGATGPAEVSGTVPAPGDPQAATTPGPPAQPTEEAFGVFFSNDHVTLTSNDLRLVDDATQADITPEWTSALAEWTGVGERTELFTVWLMTPNTSGSVLYPGPRWLKVSFEMPSEGGPHGDYVLSDWRSVSAGQGYLIYVDTDDPAEADAVDPNDLDFDSSDGFAFAPGLHWAWGSGTATLSELSGTVSGRGPDLDDDGGEVSASVSLDGVRVQLPSGGTTTMSGDFSVSADKPAPVTSPGGPTDGGGASTLPGPSCSGAGGGWNCVNCEAQSEGDNPYGLGTDDPQVWTQCAVACTYYDASHSAEAASAAGQADLAGAIAYSCAVLAGFGSQYEAACAYCP